MVVGACECGGGYAGHEHRGESCGEGDGADECDAADEGRGDRLGDVLCAYRVCQADTGGLGYQQQWQADPGVGEDEGVDGCR
jgi:hypothetical protein